jgi:hypothetical protein
MIAAAFWDLGLVSFSTSCMHISSTPELQCKHTPTRTSDHVVMHEILYMMKVALKKT